MKQCIKKIAMSVLVLAMVITMLPMDTQAATVKLNKKAATIYIGEKVTLKLNGAKSVIWSSSNKKIATVTSKGVVKGVKAGSCKVTAKNKKTGKSYTCRVTVKALKNLVNDGDIGINQEEKAIYICIDPSVIGKKVNVTVNGEKTFSRVATKDDTNGDGYVLIWYDLKEQGEYKVTVSADGYKEYTTVVTYDGDSAGDSAGSNMIDYVGLFKGSDGSYVDCMINKSVLGTKVSITINGETVFSDIASQENGEIIDGCWDYTYKLSEKGEYSVVISIDGQEDYKTVVSY